MERPGKKQGVTLLELVFGLFIVSALLTVGIPLFDTTFDKERLRGAAQRLAAETRQARAVAELQGQPVTLTVKAGYAWCIGLSDDGACDCGESSSCRVDGVRHAVEGSEFRGVKVQGPGVDTTFDPASELPRQAFSDWPVVLESAGGRRLAVRLNLLGNPDICSPADAGEHWAYASC